MNMIQQLFDRRRGLIALPFVVKLLWRLHLFPLGCWLVATRLFWPKWAAANETPLRDSSRGEHPCFVVA